MKLLLVLGSVVLVVGIADALAPAPEGPADPVAADPEAVPVGYRKETLDTVNKSTSEKKTTTKSKEKVKVKTKHLKNGNTVTVVNNRSSSRTKTDELSDDYAQTNHTITASGIEDSTTLTKDKKRKLHEVEMHKKADKEIIITDKYGNVISDTHKVKEKDKVKKKEKSVEKEKLVHTVKAVPTGENPTLENPPDENYKNTTTGSVVQLLNSVVNVVL